MSDQPGDAHVFDALAHPYRRQLFYALMEANPQADDDLDPLDLRPETPPEELGVSRVELVHTHLPKLDAMGYVEWEREAGRVVKGTNWEEIAPLLRLLRDNRDELPDRWGPWAGR